MLIHDVAKRELRNIDRLISFTEKRLTKYKALPEKTLVCETKKSTQLYYYLQEKTGKTQRRQYLGKADNKQVLQYKTRRFLRDLLKILRYDKKLLEHLISKYKDYSTEAVHRHLPSSYKNLPDQCYTDQRFETLKAWAAEKYERNPFPLPANPNVARDGTAFRSKGECMWYDNILSEKIPVRVEPLLTLLGKSGTYHTISPDFLFQCADCSFLAVEHFGRWDDDKYAMDNMHKIQKYLDCGFVLGDNLIVTSDNADHNTNELMIIEALEKIRKRVFGE